jgi:hypothetical protein
LRICFLHSSGTYNTLLRPLPPYITHHGLSCARCLCRFCHGFRYRVMDRQLTVIQNITSAATELWPTMSTALRSSWQGFGRKPAANSTRQMHTGPISAQVRALKSIALYDVLILDSLTRDTPFPNLSTPSQSPRCDQHHLRRHCALHLPCPGLYRQVSRTRWNKRMQY